MSVYVVNIAIPAGADFEQFFTLQTSDDNSFLDLTSYSAKSFLKKSADTSKVSAVFDVTFPSSIPGQVKISLGSTATSLLKSGRYVYDVLLDDGSKKIRVVEGTALVTAGVTTS
jgi:hypothetical protein